jgi:uncharacterized damage-inducible protein DinB
MQALLITQYRLLKGSRDVLLGYCQTLAPEDFTRELKDFGRGSIRNLLVHTVNTYYFWLEMFARDQDVVFADPDAVREVSEVKSLFDATDRVVEEFTGFFAGRYDQPLTGTIRGKAVTAAPLTLFTHVLTHEFHHKGQILSISRHMGYLPPDTDVLR